jgi:RNA polymerase sigma factor (sigma-70 family)
LPGDSGIAAVTQPKSHLEFEDFYREEYPGLLRAVYLMVGRPGEAEDLTQEAMVRVYERWEKVRAMESPVGYVYSTALNLHRKALRRLASRAMKVVSGQGSPADPAAVAETHDEVMRVLGSLPARQREALVLVELVGWDAQGAGRILGIKAESVRVHLHRARAAVRQRLGTSNE